MSSLPKAANRRVHQALGVGHLATFGAHGYDLGFAAARFRQILRLPRRVQITEDHARARLGEELHRGRANARASRR